MFLEICIATLAIPPIAAAAVYVHERNKRKMKRMKRKELILGLEGIMVSSGLSRSELEIIEQTVDRLKADKLKIKELKAENEINLETFVEAFLDEMEYGLEQMEDF